MKKQDSIKVIVAVVCLLVAGVLFFLLGPGRGGSTTGGGGQTIGTSAGGVQAGHVTEEEVQELADGEDGVTFGGSGPSPKPVPRRR